MRKHTFAYPACLTLFSACPWRPREVVKLAVIDWSRSEQAERSEDTGFSENLQHSAVRDRSLSEHVKALLDEWQVKVFSVLLFLSFVSSFVVLVVTFHIIPGSCLPGAQNVFIKS
jgi:hypothetical protein